MGREVSSAGNEKALRGARRESHLSLCLDRSLVFGEVVLNRGKVERSENVRVGLVLEQEFEGFFDSSETSVGEFRLREFAK